MKKCLAFILILLYCSTSVGASMYMHYCMGQLADAGLLQDKTKTCGHCGMDKKEAKDNGCCTEEHKFLKNTSDQKTTDLSFSIKQFAAAAEPVSFIVFQQNDLPTVTEVNPLSNAPPHGNYSNAYYILHRSLLI